MRTCVGGLFAIGLPVFAADIVIDLKQGVVTETFNTAPTPAPVSGNGLSGFTDSAGYATVKLNQKSTGACPTGFEAVVDVNLNPTGFPAVKTVRLQIEHEGTPAGWTTHIGDDPQNNGFGGGTGLQGIAEVQILDQTVSVYTTAFNPGEVDRLYSGALRLTDGSYGLTVSDQKVTLGNPRTIVETANQRQLFTLPGTDGKLYIGLNRVIADGPRKGCGVKRAVLSFE
ncbi:MAG: hypothetical protein R2762_28535 [Bryobacteraceae bacterium]